MSPTFNIVFSLDKIKLIIWLSDIDDFFSTKARNVFLLCGQQNTMQIVILQISFEN